MPPTLLERTTALLADGPLKETLTAEALLATQPAKFRAWGRHYLTTLPQMLRAERRSNFRDACLQHFGRDASGREALFDTLTLTLTLALILTLTLPLPLPLPLTLTLTLTPNQGTLRHPLE